MPLMITILTGILPPIGNPVWRSCFRGEKMMVGWGGMSMRFCKRDRMVMRRTWFFLSVCLSLIFIRRGGWWFLFTPC